MVGDQSIAFGSRLREFTIPSSSSSSSSMSMAESCHGSWLEPLSGLFRNDGIPKTGLGGPDGGTTTGLEERLKGARRSGSMAGVAPREVGPDAVEASDCLPCEAASVRRTGGGRSKRNVAKHRITI